MRKNPSIAAAMLDLDSIEVADLTADVPFEDDVVTPPIVRRPSPPPKPPPPLGPSGGPSSAAAHKRSASGTPLPSQPSRKSSRRMSFLELDSDSDSSIDMDIDPDDFGLPDSNHLGNLYADPLDDSLQAQHDRMQRGGDMPLPNELLEKVIDDVPLEEDAPVGCRRLFRGGRGRRLVKKGDLDHDLEAMDDEREGPNNIDEAFGDDLDLEDEIERDRKKIEQAARMLGLKKQTVIEHKTEEIIDFDAWGEAAVARDAVKGSPKSPALNPRTTQPQQPQAEVDAEDDMEWIQGYELGATDKERRFRSVKETKLRWRVPDMRTPLLDHQVLGVDWMVAREMSPRPPRGGLVADAMGLGKTIQSIATMCINPPLPPPEDDDKRNALRNANDYPHITLIVAPVALLEQWKEEIMTHCKRGKFSVRIHHGNDRIKSVEELQNQDVVLCTYHAVMHSYPKKPRDRKSMTENEFQLWWDMAMRRRGIFHRVKFWRVILDEAHIIKNRNGQISVACQNLEAEHTWALSGTPIQNKLEDIFPVLKFVRHPTAGYWDSFRALVPSGKDGPLKARRVQALLRGNMMRRTKKDFLMGNPLITLPKKRIRMVELELNEEELAIYKAVELHAIDTINKYVRQGTEMKNFSHILTMLLRLRQVCDHPYLILQTIGRDFTADELDRALQCVDPSQATKGEATKDEPATKGKQATEDEAEKPSALRRILLAARKKKPVDIQHCSLCLGPMENPVITRKCRHTFCRDCIVSNLENSDLHCPHSSPSGICNQRVTEDDLRIVCGTKVLDDDDNDWLAASDLDSDFAPSTKTLAFQQQLAEWSINHPADKIVLFSQFTKMLDLLEKVVEDEGIGYTRYQGGMSMGERQESLQMFRDDPDTQIILMSIKAGGVGLNLTHANLVVSVDLWWNVAVELQAFDRVHRLGQKKEVFITRFVTKGTVEQRILGLQQKKLAVAKAALGEGGMALGKLTREELLGLFGTIEWRNGRQVLRAYNQSGSRDQPGGEGEGGDLDF